VPELHDALAHTVEGPQSSQAPPWHLPSVLQLVALVGAQSPRGSDVPSVALLQAPSVPPVSAAEHASQAPAHARSQHTPSMQNPVAHAVPVEQGVPTAAPPVPLELELPALVLDEPALPELAPLDVELVEPDEPVDPLELAELVEAAPLPPVPRE
jgi:hypothetical protein